MKDTEATTYEGASKLRHAIEVLRPIMEGTDLTVGEVFEGLGWVCDEFMLDGPSAAKLVRRVMDDVLEEDDFHKAVKVIFGARMIYEIMRPYEVPAHKQLLAAALPVLARTGMSVAEAVEVLRSWAAGEGEQ